MATAAQAKHRWWQSLRLQIMGWLSICALVPLTIVALQGYHCAREAIIDSQTTHLKSVLAAREARILDWYAERQADLRAAGRWFSPDVRGGQLPGRGTAGKPPAHLNAVLERLRAAHPAFDSLAVYDESWRRIADSRAPSHDGGDLLTPRLRDALVEATDVVVSRPHVHANNQIGIHLGVPLRTPDGKPDGYLIAAIPLTDTLYPILEDRTGLDDTTKTYLVTASGKYLSGPRWHDQVLSRGTQFPSGFLQAESQRAPIYKDCCGNPVLGMAAPMPELEWILVAEVDSSEAFAWLARLRNRAIWAASVALLAALAVGWRGARSIARPFRELSAVARSVAAGRHNERVPGLDSSEAQAMGDALNRMLDELATASRRLANSAALAAVGELSSSVVHEMRNPLASIKLNLTALRDVLEDPDDVELAEIGLTEAVRTEHMLNELLAYGRPLEPSVETVDISQLLKDAVAVSTAQAQSKGVGIEIECAAAPGMLEGDRELLLRALTNLVKNAVEASPPDGRVVVGAFAEDDSAGTMLLTVTDAGAGVPADELDRIFLPFHTTKADGTGLGLANVKKIAKCHGGDVSVTNSTEGGARFAIRLPKGSDT